MTTPEPKTCATLALIKKKTKLTVEVKETAMDHVNFRLRKTKTMTIMTLAAAISLVPQTK
jgi:hypothetical protein